MASSFTSPLSLALLGVGATAKAGNAVQKLAQTGQQLNRAQQMAMRTAPAAKNILAGAGAGFSGKGSYDLATGKPIDTLLSAGAVLGGGQSRVSPEQARKSLQGGAMLFGGAAGTVSPFRFSQVPLREIPNYVLPENAWISASNHNNIPLTVDQARS
jgi:hypothetical protein